jgi:hypothetical protein
MPFTVELCGSGTPGTPPFWGKLLKCCGAQEIITPGVSVEYKPASANIPSLTAALYTGSTIKKIWGARGDLNIALDKQKAVLGAFTLTGMDFSVVDGGYLAGINYTNIRGPQFLAAGFLFDSYAAVVSKLELSLSNNVVLPDNALAASGFNPAVITRRKPQLTLDPESVACSVKDFYGLWRSSSGAAVSITLGSTPGNIVTITMPIAQVEDLKLADRKEIRTRQITALLKEDAGDDEWSILLT